MLADHITLHHFHPAPDQAERLRREAAKRAFDIFDDYDDEDSDSVMDYDIDTKSVVRSPNRASQMGGTPLGGSGANYYLSPVANNAGDDTMDASVLDVNLFGAANHAGPAAEKLSPQEREVSAIMSQSGRGGNEAAINNLDDMLKTTTSSLQLGGTTKSAAQRRKISNAFDFLGDDNSDGDEDDDVLRQYLAYAGQVNSPGGMNATNQLLSSSGGDPSIGDMMADGGNRIPSSTEYLTQEFNQEMASLANAEAGREYDDVYNMYYNDPFMLLGETSRSQTGKSQTFFHPIIGEAAQPGGPGQLLNEAGGEFRQLFQEKYAVANSNVNLVDTSKRIQNRLDDLFEMFEAD